jgi:hypothetical protein
MAEIRPPETHPNNGGGGGSSGGGGGALTSSETVGSKRQRRPSVRLGEIGGGDQLYESQHHRRTASNSNKQWKQQQQQSLGFKEASKSSKTRALTNLSEFNEILDGDNDINLDSVAIGSWRVNHSSKKRGSLNVSAKRVRSNWVSKFDDSSGGRGNGGEGEEKYSGGEDDDDEEEEEEEEEEEDCREFDVENSETLLKEQSRIRDPLDNLEDGNERNGREVHCYRRVIRGRNDRNVNHDYRHDGVDLSGPSDNDMRDYRNIGRCGGGGEDGVRIWLNSLGLGRYAPVFEIHEVDDEVLPKLTLEDLKDMGINAVGSRRKMFCAIQKLGKGFS